MTTWLDAIASRDFGYWARAMLVTEAQRTRLRGDLPPGFGFLSRAFVDLGFDRLGLTDAGLDAVLRAFVGAGVVVPSTPYRLRFIRPVLSVVEPADGGEAATLPAHWSQGVLVVGRGEKFTWIGKRVPRGWLTRTALRDYEDAGEGWVPISNADGGCDGHE